MDRPHDGRQLNGPPITEEGQRRCGAKGHGLDHVHALSRGGVVTQPGEACPPRHALANTELRV